MKDKLESFISENREGFDPYLPDKNIWYRLENQLDRKDQSKIILIWSTKIAAVLVAVLVCGIVLGISISKSNSSDINYASSPALQKYQETEQYYQQQVNLKLGELKDSNTISTVEVDLKQLDEIYNQLRQEMIQSNYTNTEVMINAMIKNQKTKIEILENILSKQNKVSNDTEKISI